MPRRLSILVGLGALWAIYLLPAQIEPTHFVHDDSYFYVQIAANVVEGRGSTFHEITPTNGYHPLWMVFCVAALAIADGDKILGLHVVALIQAMLLLGTVIFFRRIATLLGLRSFLVGAGLLAAFFMSTALYGSEAHLNVFTLTLGTYLLLSARERPSARTVTAGIVLGLAILARLDNIFVVGALAGGFVVFSEDGKPRRMLRRFVTLFTPIVIVVGGYLVYNYLDYGHLMPISGAIKSTFPNIVGSLDNLSDLGKLVSVLAMGSIVISAVGRIERTRRWILAAMGVGVLARSCYLVLFTDHYTFWSWYYVPGVLNAALLAVIVVDRIRCEPSIARHRRLADTAFALLVIGLILGGVSFGWAKALTPERIGPVEVPVKLAVCRWPEQVGAWMKENLPPRSGVLVYDWPGALAVHSDLRILPADGLINDFEYNDVLPAVKAKGYLCQHDVDYYFGRQASEPGPVGPQEELRVVEAGEDWQSLEIHAPLTGESGGTFRIDDADLVIRIRDIVDCPEEVPDAAIWRLTFDCSH